MSTQTNGNEGGAPLAAPSGAIASLGGALQVAPQGNSPQPTAGGTLQVSPTPVAEPEKARHKATGGPHKQAKTLAAELTALVNGLDKHAKDARKPNIDETAVVQAFGSFTQAHAQVISDRAQEKLARENFHAVMLSINGQVSALRYQLEARYGKGSLIVQTLGFPVSSPTTDDSLKHAHAENEAPAQPQPVATTPVTPAPVAGKPAKHKKQAGNLKQGMNDEYKSTLKLLQTILAGLPKASQAADFPTGYTTAWAQGLINQVTTAQQQIGQTILAYSQDLASFKTLHAQIAKQYRIWVSDVYACYGKTSIVLLDYGLNVRKTSAKHEKKTKARAAANTQPTATGNQPAALSHEHTRA